MPSTPLERIGDICSLVNTVRSPRKLLEVSLQKILELFDAHRGSIFLMDPKTRHLVLKAAMGEGGVVGKKEMIVKRVGEGVVGRVAHDKKPIFVEDLSTDRRFGHYTARRSYRTTSFICAPLLLKDQLLGVINITDKANGSRFREEELQILDFLATQIALNLRRLQLYTKFKSTVRESRSLKDQLGRTARMTDQLKRQIVLQEKLATIGKLTGGIAHEFNNPLDGVMRYTHLCLEHVQDELVRGYLLEIKQGLNRMVKIVKSLLACSRNADARGQTIEPRHAVEQALEALHPEIVTKGIRVTSMIDPAPCRIRDLGFEQLVQNLLRNAVDAVKEGGRIRLEIRIDEGTCIFEIRDDGCGIPETEIEKIFEPFYTTKEIDKGCGLGLTIVSEVVKSYNAGLNVVSTPNKGTIFTITIPLASNREEAA